MATRTEYISSTVNSRVRRGSNTSAIADVATATEVSDEYQGWTLAIAIDSQIFRSNKDFWGTEQNFAGTITGTINIWNDETNRKIAKGLILDSCGLTASGATGGTIKDSPHRFSQEGENSGDDYIEGNPNFGPANLAAMSGAAQTFDLTFTLNNPVFGTWP